MKLVSILRGSGLRLTPPLFSLLRSCYASLSKEKRIYTPNYFIPFSPFLLGSISLSRDFYVRSTHKKIVRAPFSSCIASGLLVKNISTVPPLAFHLYISFHHFIIYDRPDEEIETTP
jgi:hypothetical protein